MTENHRLTLDRLRREYKDLVTARKFEEAVDLLTEVGKTYYAMSKDKTPIPLHFLDPKDDLL